MMKKFRRSLFASLTAAVVLCSAGHTMAQLPPAKPTIPAKLEVANPAEDPTKPSPGGVRWFMPSHGRNMARTADKKPIELCFFGDSITQGWDGGLFNKYFGQYSPANFGVGGDKIQHQLWRIENGELKGHSPKVIVLLIGTNNLGFISAGDVAFGIANTVKNLQGKFPTSKILLLGIFPKAEAPLAPNATPPAPQDTLRGKTAIVNAMISKLDDKKMVRYLDLTPKFLDADGKILGNVLKDGVHLTPQGFTVWGDNMAPLLAEMMGK